MSGQERKLDAAEYVIGTLSAVERKAFEASIETDDTTREDVLFWERTFGALNASVSPEAAPDGLWDKIAADLPGGDAVGTADAVTSATEKPETTTAAAAMTETQPASKPAAKTAAANDNLAEQLRRSRSRWRFMAVAASVAAIALGAYIANGPNSPLTPPSEQVAGLDTGKEYIAVVNANGDQPSLVINIDAATGEVTVRSIGVQRPEGKSLEVWYVPEGQTPISVGLVGEGEIDLKDIQAKDGDLLAISVEPPGGSPTGVATGDVIYTGKLIENPQ